MSDAAELLAKGFLARREGRFDDAHRDFHRAVELCRQHGPRRDLIRALKGLGQIERDLCHPENAQLLYEEAVELCRNEADPLLLAHTIRHLGDIHLHNDRPELAEPCYVEAIDIYRGHENASPLDLANTLRPLAILKQEAGNAEEARSLWGEAKGLYGSVGVQAGVDECSSALKRLGQA